MSDTTEADATDEVQVKRLIPDMATRGAFRNTLGLTADEILFVAVPPLAIGYLGARLGVFAPGDNVALLASLAVLLFLGVQKAPYHLTPYTLAAKAIRFGRARQKMPLGGTSARAVPGVDDVRELAPGEHGHGHDLDGRPVGVGEASDGRLFAAVLADPEGATGAEHANTTYLDREEWVSRAAAFADEYDAALATAGIDAQVSLRVRPPAESGSDGEPAAGTEAVEQLLQDPGADLPEDARTYAGELLGHTTRTVEGTELAHRRLAVVVDARGSSGIAGGVRGAVRGAVPGLPPEEDPEEALLARVEKAEEVARAVGGGAEILDGDGLGHMLREFWLGDGTGGIAVTDSVAVEGERSIRGNDAVRAARDQDSGADPARDQTRGGEESGGKEAPTTVERVAAAGGLLRGRVQDAASQIGSSRRTALWGPSEVDEHRTHVEIDDGALYTSSLWLSSWPTAPDVGLLSSIATAPGVAFDLSLHVGAPDRREKVAALDDEMQTLSTAGWRQSQQGEGGRAGDAQRHHGEKRALRDYAKEEDVEIAEVSATITVRGADADAVADARETLRDRCRRIGVTATPAHGDQRAALTSTAPVADDKLNRVLRSHVGEALSRWINVRVQLGVDTRADMPTDTLGCILPPLHAVRQDENGVSYGLAQARHPNTSALDPAGVLQINRKHLTSPHRYTIGRSGAGKTYREIAQLFDELLRGTLSRCVILDISENFEGLVEAFDGSRVDPTETLLNPFAISPGGGAGLGEKVNLVADLLLIFLMHNAPEERALELRPVIKSTVSRTYERAGITDDPETHGRPSPVFFDWLDTLEAVEEDSSEVSLRDTGGEREEWAEDAAWLLTRFASFPEEYGFLCPDPEAGDDPEGEVDVDDRVVLFDLSDYQDKDDAAKGMMAAHILSHTFRTAKRAGPEELVGVCIDEAHDVFADSQRAGRFETTVRAGRNHGLAFDFLSQAAGDFAADEAEVIAQQCSVTTAATLGDGADESELRHIGFNREQAAAIAGGLEPGESPRGFSEAMVNVEGDTYRTAFTTSPVMDAMIDYRERDDGPWRQHVDRALLDLDEDATPENSDDGQGGQEAGEEGDRAAHAPGEGGGNTTPDGDSSATVETGVGR